MIEWLTELFTAIGLVCYAQLAFLFWRAGRADALRTALFGFFAILAVVFGVQLIVEVISNVSRIDPVYGSWRPVFARGMQAFAAVWLLVALGRKGGGDK